MIPLHEETNPDGSPKCVQWMVGDAHYTGRRMCLPNGMPVGNNHDYTALVKVSYTGELVFVDDDLLTPYQRPENKVTSCVKSN